jgi:hypothetical protein
MLLIPVSVGELIDKISILQIKKNHVQDDNKLANIEKELNALLRLAQEFLQHESISSLYEDLIGVNTQLWNTEDMLRSLERDKDFGDSFVAYARDVYHLNDQRFKLKNKINLLTQSEIQEVKQHIDYQ